MNPKTTLILLLLLAACSGVWYFATRTPQTAQTIETADVNADSDALFGGAIAPADVRGLKLSRPKHNDLVFSREIVDGQNSSWQLESPENTPIQSAQVQNLLQTLLKTRIVKELDSKSSPSDGQASGIENPVATVTLTSVKDDTYTVTIGRKPSLAEGNIVWVSTTGNLALLNRDLEPIVAKSLTDFLSPTLFDVSTGSVTGLVIKDENREFEFRREHEDWRIQKPIDAYAETAKFNQLLDAVRNLAVAEFVEDPSDFDIYGLSKPTRTITLSVEGGKNATSETPAIAAGPQTSTTLYIGSPTDPADTKRFVRLEDSKWIGQVSTAALAKIAPKVNELRDRRITRIPANQARELKMHTPTAAAEYSRINGIWRQDESEFPLEDAAIADILEAFESISATDYIEDIEDLAAYGLANPRAVVTVVGENNEAVSLEIGDITKSARNAYVRKSGAPEVIVVSGALADRLVVSPVELRSREIYSLDADAITRLTRRSATRNYVLVRGASGWTFESPSEAPVDQAAVNALLGDLSHLRARRVAAEKSVDERAAPPDATTITFTVDGAPASAGEGDSTPEGGQRELTLFESNDVHYATTDTADAVFELDPTVYRVLTGELIDREPLTVNADDVVRLTVTRPGEEITFSKQGDKWAYDADPYVTLNQNKIADAIAGLSRMQVISYRTWKNADVDAEVPPQQAVSMALQSADKSTVTVRMALHPGDHGNHVAAWVEGGKTFVIGPVDAEILLRDLNYYLEDKKPQ
ncbi:MAG: DUF4340 domain-containing protein [Phycisphaerae bacterium]